MKNIYFNIGDYGLIKDIIECANDYKNLHIVGFSTLLSNDVKKLDKLNIDTYVFQFSEHHDECVNFLASVAKSPYLKNVQIFALLKELNMDALHLLMQYDIKDFLIEPIHIQDLMNSLLLDKQTMKQHASASLDIDVVVNQMMQDMGLPMHLSGFRYLKTCSLLVSKECYKRFIVGHVYKECARIHNTTATRVEKAIRTAISYAFRTQPEHICIYNDKPTNSQIILYLSEKLKQYTIE